MSFLLLLTLAVAATPQPTRRDAIDASALASDPIASMRIRRGQAPIASARLRREVEQSPNDLGLSVLLGHAFALTGAYADAYVELETGRLADHYDGESIESHANVLRWLGAPGDAAALRSQSLWLGQPSSIRDLEVFLELVDDSRGDADLEGAWNSATMALALEPDRGAAHAQLAQVLMDLGRWDEAGAELAVADLLGPRSLYLVRASVRWLVHEGRLSEAKAITAEASMDNLNDPAVFALKIDVSTEAGDVDDALAIARSRRFQAVDHPQMLLARLHALRRAGADDEALAVAMLFRSIYTRPVLNSLGVREYPAN